MVRKTFRILCTILCILLVSIFSACGTERGDVSVPQSTAAPLETPAEIPEPSPMPESNAENDLTLKGEISGENPVETEVPTPEPTREPNLEDGCEPESILDKTIYALRGNGYLNKNSFTDQEQAAIQAMLENIEYIQKENFEYAWDNMLFAVKQGDTWIHFWPDNRVDYQKEGHGVVGYNCSNIDYSVLVDILSEPDDLQMEISRTQEDIDSALAAFREFFSQFEQQGCVIDRLWYEDHASAYYTLAFFGQHPEQVESERIIALFLEYSAGEIGFYTAPENEPLVIYMMREESGAQWEFESWLEGAVTQE